MHSVNCKEAIKGDLQNFENETEILKMPNQTIENEGQYHNNTNEVKIKV